MDKFIVFSRGAYGPVVVNRDRVVFVTPEKDTTRCRLHFSDGDGLTVEESLPALLGILNGNLALA